MNNEKPQGSALRTIVTLILGILGLSLLVAAAWCIALPLGLAVAGVALLVLEWRVGER